MRLLCNEERKPRNSSPNKPSATKLVNMTLPAAYQALGKQVHDADRYRDEFTELFQKIDGLQADMAALRTPEEKTEGFAAKAKAAAKTASDVAHLQPLKMKVNHAFTELGKAVFEKHGAESGPEEVVRPVLNCRTRLAKLDLEIGQLSQSSQGNVITPKRIAVAGVVVAAVVALFAVYGLFVGGTSRIVGNWSKKTTGYNWNKTVTDACSLRFTSGGSAVMSFMGRDKVVKCSFAGNRLSFEDVDSILDILGVAGYKRWMAGPPKDSSSDAAQREEQAKPREKKVVFPVEFVSDDEMVFGEPDQKDAGDLAGTWQREDATAGKNQAHASPTATSSGVSFTGILLWGSVIVLLGVLSLKFLVPSPHRYSQTERDCWCRNRRVHGFTAGKMGWQQ